MMTSRSIPPSEALLNVVSMRVMLPDGTGYGVGEGRRVGVCVGVGVCVRVGVNVLVGVFVAVGVNEGVAVGPSVGVSDGLGVAVGGTLVSVAVEVGNSTAKGIPTGVGNRSVVVWLQLMAKINSAKVSRMRLGILVTRKWRFGKGDQVNM